jgi:hypothetical protein
LSINNKHFHSYVDSIYPNELEIKGTSGCSASASYLDVLLKLDINGKMMTQLYDKRDDFNFSIVNFPYLCSNIPASPAYGMYISQPIRSTRACSPHNQFLVRGSLLTNKLMSLGVSTVSFSGSFPQILWSLQRSYLPIQPFFGPYAILFVSYQSLSRY